MHRFHLRSSLLLSLRLLKRIIMTLCLHVLQCMISKQKEDSNNIYSYHLASMKFITLFCPELAITYIFCCKNYLNRAFKAFYIGYNFDWELLKIFITQASIFIKVINSHILPTSLNQMNSSYYKTYAAFASNLGLLMNICPLLKTY